MAKPRRIGHGQPPTAISAGERAACEIRRQARISGRRKLSGAQALHTWLICVAEEPVVQAMVSKAALNAFAITFGGRFPAAKIYYSAT
jgi:hypothetical protein